jgi:hypothetical protein
MSPNLLTFLICLFKHWFLPKIFWTIKLDKFYQILHYFEIFFKQYLLLISLRELSKINVKNSSLVFYDIDFYLIPSILIIWYLYKLFPEPIDYFDEQFFSFVQMKHKTEAIKWEDCWRVYFILNDTFFYLSIYWYYTYLRVFRMGFTLLVHLHIH